MVTLSFTVQFGYAVAACNLVEHNEDATLTATSDSVDLNVVFLIITVV